MDQERILPAGSAVASDGMTIEGGPMLTLLGHLNELKDHLIRIAIALVVCSLGAFIFATRIFEWLLLPVQRYGDRVRLTALTPTSAIGTYVKVAAFSGAIVAMPFIIYQLLRFIIPGLTARERRVAAWVIPGATLFFLGGVAFAFFVMLPPSLSFLFHFWDELIDQMWTIEEYMTFVTGLVFWVGVSFEAPLLMAFASWIGLLSARQMLGAWKFATVAIAVLAALITPTPDWFNMTLVMAPLFGLYLLGILMAWLAEKRTQKR